MICPGDSALTLDAASSMASGIPSRFEHSSATAEAFSRVRAKRGETARARSSKSRTDPKRSNALAF